MCNNVLCSRYKLRLRSSSIVNWSEWLRANCTNRPNRWGSGNGGHKSRVSHELIEKAHHQFHDFVEIKASLILSYFPSFMASNILYHSYHSLINKIHVRILSMLYTTYFMICRKLPLMTVFKRCFGEGCPAGFLRNQFILSEISAI